MNVGSFDLKAALREILIRTKGRNLWSTEEEKKKFWSELLNQVMYVLETYTYKLTEQEIIDVILDNFDLILKSKAGKLKELISSLQETATAEISQANKNRVKAIEKENVEDILDKLPDTNDTIHNIHGIKNIGNTCYMNSALQCLIFSDLTEFVLSDDLKETVEQVSQFKNSKYKGALLVAWGQFLTDYRDSKEKALDPTKLKKTFVSKNDDFNNTSQQDSQEFLTQFLDGLHEDTLFIDAFFDPKLKPTASDPDPSTSPDKDLLIERYMKLKPISIVASIFQGYCITERACPTKNFTSYNMAPFMTITLEIPKTGSTIEDCFEYYMRKKKREDIEEFNCGDTKSSPDQTEQIEFVTLPDIFICSLKRFLPTRNPAVFTRNNTSIEFSEDLDLSPYCVDKTEEQNYKLFAYSLHSGTMTGGHYTAKINSDKWYLMNDSSADPTKPFEESDFKGAYILMYKKDIT
jgi:ubiquitin carboxyl-terminal hydrolase 8